MTRSPHWRIARDTQTEIRWRNLVVVAAGSTKPERRYHMTFDALRRRFKANHCAEDLRRINPSVAAAVENYCANTTPRCVLVEE